MTSPAPSRKTAEPDASATLPIPGDLPIWARLCCGGVAGLVAQGASYPLHVAWARRWYGPWAVRWASRAGGLWVKKKSLNLKVTRSNFHHASAWDWGHLVLSRS